MKKSLVTGPFLSMLLLFARPLSPCSIPVFHYALARWTPDDYHALVIVNGDVTEEENDLISALNPERRDSMMNLTVQVIDISTSSGRVKELLQNDIPERFP